MDGVSAASSITALLDLTAGIIQVLLNLRGCWSRISCASLITAAASLKLLTRSGTSAKGSPVRQQAPVAGLNWRWEEEWKAT
jgi:hypothetical protein